MTFENFASILSPKPNEAVEVRIKQRIIVKFLIVLVLRSRPQIPVFTRLFGDRVSLDRAFNDERNEYKARIIELYYTVAHFSGEQLAEDSLLLREWDALQTNDVGTNDEDVDRNSFYMYVRIIEFSLL